MLTARRASLRLVVVAERGLASPSSRTWLAGGHPQADSLGHLRRPCAARYHIVREGQALEAGGLGGRHVVSVRVASKGLSDELKGGMYAVIETPTGHAYHVPLAARLAEDLRSSDIVSFTTKPEAAVRPVDRHIADVARARGGVYALNLETDVPIARSASRRLSQLERLGLAAPAGPDRWTVSPNLLKDLEERHRPAVPKHRIFIRKEPLSLADQIRHPGPVWLDRVDAASMAPYGFGAELRRATRGRSEQMRQLGIAPDDPKRHAALRELERRAVGKKIAADSGRVFVPVVPDRLRGHVQLQEAPGGGSYTVVSDGSRFAVLRTTTSLRAMQGKSVVVSRDSKARFVVRQDPDRGLGR
jgi:hypothetical protein